MISISELPEPVKIWSGIDGGLCLLYSPTVFEAADLYKRIGKKPYPYRAPQYFKSEGIFLREMYYEEFVEGYVHIYFKVKHLPDYIPSRRDLPYFGYKLFSNYLESE